MIEDVLDQVDQVSAQTSLGPSLSGPEMALIAKAESGQLHAALRRLPAVFREILVLKELEDLSYQEIAGIIASQLAQ